LQEKRVTLYRNIQIKIHSSAVPFREIDWKNKIAMRTVYGKGKERDGTTHTTKIYLRI